MMTHRERFLKALSHQEPDRVPFDLGGSVVTSVSAVAYTKLVDALGLPARPTRTRNLFAQSAELDEDVLRILDVDTRPTDVRGGWRIGPAHVEGDVLQYVDEWQIGYAMPMGATSMSVVKNPLVAAASPRDVEKAKWPDARDPSRFDGLLEQARRRVEEEQVGVILETDIGGVFEWPAWLRGMERFLYDLSGNPALAEALIGKVGEWKVAFWEAALSRVGPYVDLVRESDDLGSQTGLLISPKMYRQYFKPWHTRLCETIRKHTDAAICLHSCGSIWDLVPDLIDAGFTALNPVQIGARKMDAVALKREFGRDLVFWGAGFDSQRLPFANPNEIKEQARRSLEALAPGGGYVFAPINMVQADVPPENIMALADAVREF